MDSAQNGSDYIPINVRAYNKAYIKHIIVKLVSFWQVQILV